ncbi:hypothetical protein TVAG_248910 [Trichomonas vaginalis G3]|uniref:Uncharacterized protein n=1 Tax=Trichomonas vaginalis (strain ATCC PRA-98 / G3) TaxID=412133 RepID=A2DC95_TRIV3|nr:hypothetical protein TVAGG3_0957970 [Trichomonas vaginalis G3]EAY21832.1 hypothetical protein TVAG_248910 [Trichomonas vaginalis G3]KAI5487698.1 hypothetical protein TVAGG3_0957970 [Trichomonas vaginalis G3]|eukprot:XP_001582818.1 hypothetical protein [Trichomonas vaginalis G3]
MRRRKVNVIQLPVENIESKTIPESISEVSHPKDEDSNAQKPDNDGKASINFAKMNLKFFAQQTNASYSSSISSTNQTKNESTSETKNDKEDSETPQETSELQHLFSQKYHDYDNPNFIGPKPNPETLKNDIQNETKSKEPVIEIDPHKNEKSTERKSLQELDEDEELENFDFGKLFIQEGERMIVDNFFGKKQKRTVVDWYPSRLLKKRFCEYITQN